MNAQKWAQPVDIRLSAKEWFTIYDGLKHAYGKVDMEDWNDIARIRCMILLAVENDTEVSFNNGKIP